jgi:hypothetical protein
MPISTTIPDVPVAPLTEAQRREAAEQRMRERREAAAMIRGEKHTVAFMPPEEGQPARPDEEIKVRLLPVAEYQAFYTKQTDEVAMIALCCNRPVEWVTDLRPESHRELVEACIALNFMWVTAWVVRQGAVTASMVATS